MGRLAPELHQATLNEARGRLKTIQSSDAFILRPNPQLVEPIQAEINASVEALRVYDNASLQVPTPQVMSQTAARLGLSTVTTDLLMAQQNRFPVMMERHFAGFPVPTVRRAISSAGAGDTGALQVMMDQAVFGDDGTVQTDSLKEILEFLNGFGFPKKTLDTIKQRYVDR